MNNASSSYQARYLDGVTSHSQEVALSLTDQSLIISGAQKTLAIWPYAQIFVKEDWIDHVGAILGSKDHPDASLSIHNSQQFQKILQKLIRRHQASFIIPTQYRHLFLMAVGAVAAGFLFFPAVKYLADGVTYLIPKSVDAKLGQLVIDDMADTFKPCDDKDAIASLQKITKRLSLASGEKSADPQIYLLHSTAPNAFSLPGEKIAVLSAFLNDVTSENEIAGVLAHEMGHMAKRDAMEAFIESQGIGLIAGLISSSGSYSGVAEFVSFMQSMNYSRQKEFRADEYGTKLLVKAGYSPEGLSSFLSRMSKKEKEGLLGNAMEYVEFLSTHPDTQERIKRIPTYAKKSDILFKNSLTQDEFLKLKNACRTPLKQRGNK